MNTLEYNDILVALRSPNKSLRERGYRALYKGAFPLILHFVKGQGGTYDGALDVYHEALTATLLKIEEPEFQLTATLESFIYGVAKNKWRQQRDKSKLVSLSNDADWQYYQVTESYEPQEEAEQKLADNFLFELVMKHIVYQPEADKCKNLLLDYYGIKRPKLNMTEIAFKHDFGNSDSAKSQKAKCINKYKSLFLNNPLVKEIIKNGK